MQLMARFNTATAARRGDGLSLSASGYGYGLGVSRDCDVGHIVAHSGGLPGFGSLMRWLPEYGVGVIAMGNRTYTGWGTPVTQAVAALRETGGLVPRVPQPSPVLLAMQHAVSSLVARWDDATAARIAAMNLYLDEPAPRRRAALERLVAQVGGGCATVGPMVAENALRGEWRIGCAQGALRVFITLAPTEPARVQQWDVAVLREGERLGPAPACRVQP
jgi:hypothetical protein